MPRNDLLLFRRGTAAEWASANPVLASGEVGFAIDTNELRVGNGTDGWNELEKIGGPFTFLKVTQAEYDALPTPRPDDVIYIITP